MEKNEESEGLHARTQPDSEILTFEIEVSSSPNEEKAVETNEKRQSDPPPNKKQALSERKAAFFPKKTYVLTTGNLQSDDRKPTIRQQKACFLTPQKPLPCPFPPPVPSFHARSLSAKAAHLHLSVNETKKTDNRMTIRPSGYPSPEAPVHRLPKHTYI